ATAEATLSNTRSRAGPVNRPPPSSASRSSSLPGSILPPDYTRWGRFGLTISVGLEAVDVGRHAGAGRGRAGREPGRHVACPPHGGAGAGVPGAAGLRVVAGSVGAGGAGEHVGVHVALAAGDIQWRNHVGGVEKC